VIARETPAATMRSAGPIIRGETIHVASAERGRCLTIEATMDSVEGGVIHPRSRVHRRPNLSCSRAIARGVTARILIVGLGLVITSPLWHGDCHHLNLVAMASSQQSSPQVVRPDGASFATETAGSCLTCLSQRLLTQVQVEQAREASEPPRTFADAPARTHTVTITLTDYRRSRAPPAS